MQSISNAINAVLVKNVRINRMMMKAKIRKNTNAKNMQELLITQIKH